MLPNFALAGGIVRKAMMPVGFYGLAVEGHGGRTILGAAEDVDNAVAGLVCNLDGPFWNVEIAGEGSKAHHANSSGAYSSASALTDRRAQVPPQMPSSNAGKYRS